MATEAAGPTETLTSDLLRVMLVDDHDLFRTGLRNLLEEQGVQPDTMLNLDWTLYSEADDPHVYAALEALGVGQAK